MDSVLEEFIVYQYGKEDATEILRTIRPMKRRMLNGNILSLKMNRISKENDFANQENVFAKEALNECMDKISKHLNRFNEEDVFDNKSLLKDLHVIINATYSIYAKKCNSDIDAEALVQTLGVLYGSIEYWTNSSNVKFWSKIKTGDEQEISSETALLPAKTRETFKKGVS